MTVFGALTLGLETDNACAVRVHSDITRLRPRASLSPCDDQASPRYVGMTKTAAKLEKIAFNNTRCCN
jgi:hypothetical protein